MKTIHFEVEIDDQIIDGIPDVSSDIFCDDAKGKTFLFIEPVGKGYTAVYCQEPKEGNRNAKLLYYYLPVNARIVATEEGTSQDDTPKSIREHLDTQTIELMKRMDGLSGVIVHQLIEHIQQCCDKGTETTQHYAQSLLTAINEANANTAEHPSSTTGISEHTLLRALEIVIGQSPTDQNP